MLNHLLRPWQICGLLDGEPGAGGGAGGAGGSGAGSPAGGTKDFLDFDLPSGVKVAVPKEALQPLATWRDGVKGELTKLTAETEQLRPFKTQVEKLQADLTKAAADLPAAQQQVAALTVKVTDLEKTAATATASEGALAKILEARMAQVPDSMKGLVKGGSTIEKLQSYEDLYNAGVFKITNPGPRLPGVGSASEMTYDEYNAQTNAQRVGLQKLIQEGKLKLVEKRAV